MEGFVLGIIVGVIVGIIIGHRSGVLRGFNIGKSAGEIQAHHDIAIEIKKLGKFYVADEVFCCHAIEKFEPTPSPSSSLTENSNENNTATSGEKIQPN